MHARAPIRSPGRAHTQRVQEPLGLGVPDMTAPAFRQYRQVNAATHGHYTPPPPPPPPPPPDDEYVDFDEAFLRPAEVDALVGDSAHARSVTGWEPKVMTPELARIMVDADVKIVESAGSQWIDRPYDV